MTYKPVGVDESGKFPPRVVTALDSTYAKVNSLVFNAKDYGAVGNGTTDDTAALQAAYAAALAAGGGTLYIPAGTYKWTAAKVWDSKVQVKGAGILATVIQVSGLTAGQIALTLSGHYAKISDLTIKQATTDSTVHALGLGDGSASKQTANGSVDRVKISGFGYQVQPQSNSYIWKFSDCYFDAAQTASFYGASTLTNSGEAFKFVGCTFANSPATLVDIEGSGFDVFFVNCSFDYSSKALYISKGSAHFTGCHFETGTTYGGTGTEYIDVDRSGSAFPPSVVLTGCYLYAVWNNYDTFARLGGSTFGSTTFVMESCSIRTDSSSATYLVRDDAPSASTWIIDNLIYADNRYRVQGRTFAGKSVTLTEGDRWVNGSGLYTTVNRNTVQTLPSGYYFYPSGASEFGTGNGWSNGNLHCYPVWMPPGSLSRMGLEVTTAGSTGALIRLGIYADNGSGLPGSLLLDAGTVAADAVGVVEATISTPLVLTGGVYWIGGAVQGAPATVPTVRSINASPRAHGMVMVSGTAIPGTSQFLVGIRSNGGAAAALPTTFAVVGGNSFAPRIFFKAA